MKLASGPDAFDAILLPLSLGRHVDHSTVRDAAMPLITSYPFAFYEDLPYAIREGAGRDLTIVLEVSQTDAITFLHLMDVSSTAFTS